MTEKRLQLLLPTVFLFAVACLRLIPHPPNLVPMTALCIFAGARPFAWTWRVTVPLVAVALTDALQGSSFSGIAVWNLIAYAGIVVMSHPLSNRTSVPRLLVTSLVASLIFFVVSNFGFWRLTSLYPQTPAGFIECYIGAVPFLLNSIIADAFYSLAVFGSYELLQRTLTRWSSVTNQNTQGA